LFDKLETMKETKMAINARGNGLVYKHDDDKGFSIYVMSVKNTPVFEAGVDNCDADLKIRVRKVGDTEWFITGGRAIKQGNQIDGLSVQSYVYPRMSELLFDLYVLPTIEIDVPDILPTDWSIDGDAETGQDGQ
jgi:hypothetical protein